MSYGNPFKHKIQRLVGNFLDKFLIERKPTDEEIECMQFGICDYEPKQVEEIPYFHF